MTGLNWKKIGLGLLADFAVSIAVTVVMGIAAGVALMSSGVAEQQIESRMMTWLPYLIALLVFGLGATVFGGFVAAGDSSSRQDALKNALVMGIIALLLGALLHLAVKEDVPLWYNIISYAAIIPAALFGGHLRARRDLKANRVLDPFQPPIPLP